MQSHSTTIAASPPISPPESVLDSEILELRLAIEIATASESADELLRPLFALYEQRIELREATV